MNDKLPWPTPGTCWRHAHAPFTSFDRVRLMEDGNLEQVGGSSPLCAHSIADAIRYERRGLWHRVPDAPLSKPVVDFGEPWELQLMMIPTPTTPSEHAIDRTGRYQLSTQQRDRAIACVNALAGIRNPAAVPALIAEVRRAYRIDADPITAAIAALDREPTNG